MSSQTTYNDPPEYVRLIAASVPRSDLPLYVRFPKRGEREHYSQLSYNTLDRLVRPQACNDFKPPVKSKVVIVRGNKDSRRGARLIELKSLLAYLRRAPGPLVNQPREAISV